MKKIHLLLIAALLIRAVTIAQPGTLDNTFGIGGSVTTRIGNISSYLSSTAIQADGKIIACGVSITDTLDVIALTRFNANGTLDNTFGTGGVVIKSIDGYEPYDGKLSLAIQADGKIVVWGHINPYPSVDVSFLICRFTTSGTTDNTFGTGGQVITNFGGSFDKLKSIAIESDGKIFLAGTSYTGVENLALARYTNTGLLDNTFGTNGKIITLFPPNFYAGLILIQADGKIISAGGNGNGSIVLVRHLANGQLDATFGTAGIVNTPHNAYTVSIDLIQIQTDGKIVIGGYYESVYGAKRDPLLVRYSSNGLLDSTFGIGGFAVTTTFVGGVIHPNSLAIQPDGKFVVGGYIVDSNFVDTLFIARYSSYGIIDTTFSNEGMVKTPYANAKSCTIQADGKIIAGGYRFYVADSCEFYLARYLSGLNVGILDFSVDNHSMLIYPNPINNQATLEYTLTQNEVLSAELMDMNGKLVKLFFVNEKRTAGVHKEAIVLEESIKTGNYMLVLKNTTQNIPIKIMKQ